MADRAKQATSKMAAAPMQGAGDAVELSAKVVSVEPAAKVKFSHKAMVFIAAVISLSWFFEGWRGIHKEASLVHYGTLIGGTLLTVALLGMYGYWIYFEEKSKGTLRKRIALFETINERLSEVQASRAKAKSHAGANVDWHGCSDAGSHVDAHLSSKSAMSSGCCAGKQGEDSHRG
ncbi:MAG TPA: hypothetical protein V6C72_09050 [Chroococcales cyanobacterium]